MTAKPNTAKIGIKSCNACGWPIIECCCNDEMSMKRPFKDWDWWYYCSNKGCIHHKGEGVFQDKPDFVKYEHTKDS